MVLHKVKSLHRKGRKGTQRKANNESDKTIVHFCKQSSILFSFALFAVKKGLICF